MQAATRKEALMSAQPIIARVNAVPRDRLLPIALGIDAAVTGVNGVVYFALAGPLEDLLGVRTSLLRPVGVFLVLFAMANVLWVLGSMGYATVANSPTAVGTVWTVLQASVVAGFAAMQTAGLRFDAVSARG
jgi:hypothetical protein